MAGPAVVVVNEDGVVEETTGEQMVVMVLIRSHGRWPTHMRSLSVIIRIPVFWKESNFGPNQVVPSGRASVKSDGQWSGGEAIHELRGGGVSVHAGLWYKIYNSR
jgi:hypothetical protein